MKIMKKYALFLTIIILVKKKKKFLEIMEKKKKVLIMKVLYLILNINIIQLNNGILFMNK